MDLKVFQLLGREVPESVSDIREALDLLASSIESAGDQVREKAKLSIDNKDYEKVSDLISNSKELEVISKKVQEVILDLDNIIDSNQIEEINNTSNEEIDEREIPNYNDYLVDSEVEHNLYEDLTHKRPCAIKIEGERIEVKDWKGALVKTINYLGKKDSLKLSKFVDDPKMNGKKVIYFSRIELPTMRAARKVQSAGIYVETNLSANGIRNLLIKALSKYNVKLNEYKIYLKADYSELH